MTISTELSTAPAPPVSARVADVSPLRGILDRIRAAHRRAGAPSLDERLEHIRRLDRALRDRQDDFVRAISDDFGGRSRHETLLAEQFVILEGIRHTTAHLADWMQRRAKPVGMLFQPARAEVIYQPLGVVGIISPWNYPLQLALMPLLGALAAGNRAMIKPSELTPRTAQVLSEMIASAFDPDHVTVVTGGPDVGEAFSRLAFDHLVFTGSTRLGKIVMKAAAENLTPVTLELGGKSPVIVGRDFDIEEAAAKIMTAKLLNAGQTCVAPDYALVPEGSRERFVSACGAAARKLYPSLAHNPDYTSIINDRHHARLRSYLDDARARGATVSEVNPAGESLEGTRKMAPTFVTEVTDEMTVMQDELFGPVLPVMTYRTLDDAIAYVDEHPRPLALYYFGHDAREVEHVVQRTVSGGTVINDLMLHVALDDLPFGGVGPSGIGAYHGRDGFEAFSKKKPVVYQARLNATALIAAPYGRVMEALLKVILR